MTLPRVTRLPIPTSPRGLPTRPPPSSQYSVALGKPPSKATLDKLKNGIQISYICAYNKTACPLLPKPHSHRKAAAVGGGLQQSRRSVKGRGMDRFRTPSFRWKRRRRGVERSLDAPGGRESGPPASRQRSLPPGPAAAAAPRPSPPIPVPPDTGSRFRAQGTVIQHQ